MSHHKHHCHCCHQHSQEESCSHGSCSQGSCSTQDGEEHSWCNFPEQLLELADEAWMELLKEKIKAKIESSNGKQLNELAALVSESNNSRWKNLMATKHGNHHYKEELMKYFHQK